jgi:DNA-binding transcriptional regulator GbsR (MarR family)
VNDAQERFVDDMGQHMVAWGLPRTTGRIYAYLLLRPTPATLDEVARDLGVAKSGASVATRQLIAFGLARSFGERGSRRLRYDALYDVRAIVAARAAQTVGLFDLLREAARVASSPSIKRQLARMTSALESMFSQFPELTRRADARRRA